MVSWGVGAYSSFMSIFLDDDLVELTGHDLAAVLEAAKSHLNASGRVVVEVAIDGQALSEADLAGQESVALDGKEVRLYSADPAELAVATLNGIRQRLGEAAESQDRAAELFQADKAGEALAQIGTVIEAWLQTQQAVLNSAMLLEIDLEAFAVDGRPLREFTDELLERLNELRELIEAGDTVSLADALAYEWPELTNRWDRLVEKLVESIERQD